MTGGKVLIIDDDPDIAEAMRVVLEGKGHEVCSARDSTDVLIEKVESLIRKS